MPWCDRRGLPRRHPYDDLHRHLHSHSCRIMADQPWRRHAVTLILMARTLRRTAVACPRTVFAERRTPLGEPWAPLTTRLRLSARWLQYAHTRWADTR
jgi:hypothetical protein